MQDAGGLSGRPELDVRVSVNRCAPIPPPDMDATGRNANTTVVDIDWQANPEGDIAATASTAARASRAGDAGVPGRVPAGQVIAIDAATECIDSAPPAYSSTRLYYAVVAVDRDASGALREGATAFIQRQQRATSAPNALDRRSRLTADRNGRKLTSSCPNTLDPDSGDTIESFRIYRRAAR